MPLPSFDKQSDIPKGFEDEYEEQDGKWVPIDHASSLKAALDEEKKAREAAEKVAKKAAREAAEAAARAAGKDAGLSSTDLTAAYKKIEENVHAEYAERIAELEKLKAENRGLALTDRLRARFLALGVVEKRADQILRLHEAEFDLAADKKPIVKSEPGKDIDKHILGILKQYPEWTKGTRAAGSGASPLQSAQPSSSVQSGPVSFDDLVKNPGAAIAAANNQ